MKLPTNRPVVDADDILEGILTWVQIESPTHDAAAVTEVVDLVETEMRMLGAEIDRTPGRMLGRQRPSDGLALLSGDPAFLEQHLLTFLLPAGFHRLDVVTCLGRRRHERIDLGAHPSLESIEVGDLGGVG